MPWSASAHVVGVPPDDELELEDEELELDDTALDEEELDAAALDAAVLDAAELAALEPTDTAPDETDDELVAAVELVVTAPLAELEPTVEEPTTVEAAPPIAPLLVVEDAEGVEVVSVAEEAAPPAATSAPSSTVAHAAAPVTASASDTARKRLMEAFIASSGPSCPASRGWRPWQKTSVSRRIPLRAKSFDVSRNREVVSSEQVVPS